MPNNLINETSPYLLQHAHNPVNWYPWGPEALELAKNENKPILVSIGYAACHWCHVMEKESFENHEVAKLMNANFINIKVDREERPDIDHIYMDAVQAMTGSGGWPLNAFLTPEAKPFYGGTYFPPVHAYNRSSWTDVLVRITEAWKKRRDEIIKQAENLTNHLINSDFSTSLKIDPETNAFTVENCKSIFENILQKADNVWGGFGQAPKFPQTFSIQYLLQFYHFSGKEEALKQALLSIDKMLDGGIYDHLGGGLARYSTDNEWLAPHFEKMLYDNALFINVLTDAFQITGEKKYENAIHQIIHFLQRELTDNKGGFYAAIDADSEGEEGKFYVWQKNEIEEILQEDADLFCNYYDVSEKGNWEGENILRVLKPMETFAHDHKISVAHLEDKLETCRQKLLHQRNKRIRPITDDKILLNWNALMITALCKAGSSLSFQPYKTLAIQTFEFIVEHLRTDKDIYAFNHTYKKGKAKYPAFLDDYAYLIQACIHLQEITLDVKYLQWAGHLARQVIADFLDETNGYFFYTPKDQKDIIVRKKEVYDGAVPSGNAIMADNLFYLSIVFNHTDWHNLAQKMVGNLEAAIVKYPLSFSIWASVLIKQTAGINEIVIIGAEMEAYKNELLLSYIPNKIVQGGLKQNEEYPLLANKPDNSETLIYNCFNYSCEKPMNTPNGVLKLLQPTHKFV